MVETVRREVGKAWMERVRGRDIENGGEGERRGWKGLDGEGKRKG